MRHIKVSSVIVFATALFVFGSTGLVLWHNRDNSPEQNKKIEIRAFESGNPKICNYIKGHSYYFDGADNEISTTQTQAISQCTQNLKDGTEPYLIAV